MMGIYLRTLLRMVFRSIFTMRAPVAVVYEGGGVYLGGASDRGVPSEIMADAVRSGRVVSVRSGRSTSWVFANGDGLISSSNLYRDKLITLFFIINQ